MIRGHFPQKWHIFSGSFVENDLQLRGSNAIMIRGSCSRIFMRIHSCGYDCVSHSCVCVCVSHSCVYVCVSHLCVHVCVCHIHVYMCVCHIHVYMCVYHIHVYMCVCITFMCICVCVTFMCTCVCITYTHEGDLQVCHARDMNHSHVRNDFFLECIYNFERVFHLQQLW